MPILMPNTNQVSLFASIVNSLSSQTTERVRPVIGLTSHDKEGTSSVAHPYVEEIIEAGGAAVIIPVQDSYDGLIQTIESLDGLLLTGGADIDPQFLGEKPSPYLGYFSTQRDKTELALIELAHNRQMPILGICRGHQIINIAFGGSNYQDIPSEITPVLPHNQEQPRTETTHSIQVEADSFLSDLWQEQTMEVNSIHHQAVKSIANLFKAAATATDGINEAMEYSKPPYHIHSVQWHPEALTKGKDGEKMRLIFDYFVAQCRLYKRCRTFHQTHIILDSHCDTPLELAKGVSITDRNSTSLATLSRMQEGWIDSSIYVAYLKQGERDSRSHQQATEQCDQIIAQIKRQIEEHSELVAQARTREQLIHNKLSGKRSIMIAIENGYPIATDLDKINHYQQEGVVYITLCHNKNNEICDSAADHAEHNGLSELGKKAVKRMNELGIMIDVSHASEKTFYDVLAVSKLPIIASHSSVRALCDHRRNLTDNQIQALANHGGVVQICLYDHFIKKEGGATLEDAINHIEYVIDLVGIDHVGIGSDFDGDGGVIGCNGSNELKNITSALLTKGYSNEQIAQIWGGNLLRVLDISQKNALSQ